MALRRLVQQQARAGSGRHRDWTRSWTLGVVHGNPAQEPRSRQQLTTRKTAGTASHTRTIRRIIAGSSLTNAARQRRDCQAALDSHQVDRLTSVYIRTLAPRQLVSTAMSDCVTRAARSCREVSPFETRLLTYAHVGAEWSCLNPKARGHVRQRLGEMPDYLNWHRPPTRWASDRARGLESTATRRVFRRRQRRTTAQVYAAIFQPSRNAPPPGRDRGSNFGWRCGTHDKRDVMWKAVTVSWETPAEAQGLYAILFGCLDYRVISTHARRLTMHPSR